MKSNDARGVIFDMDGVLIDSGPAHKQSWFDLAAMEGYPISDEFFSATFGMQNYQILARLTGRELPAEEIKRMSDWKEQRYRDIISENIELPAGAQELLDGLKKDNFRLAIGSSAPKANLECVIENLYLHDYFDALVSQEDAALGKPAPDTFLKAAEKLNLEPNRCVVMEDAIHGVEAGKAAGMPVVAITTTRKKEELSIADIIVDSFTELNPRIFADLLE